MILSTRAFLLLAAVSMLAVFGFMFTTWGWIALGLDALILLLALIDSRLARHRSPDVTRIVPSTLHQGETASLALQVDNPASSSIAIRLRDLLSIELTEKPVDFSRRVAGKSQTTFGFEIKPIRRGDAHLAPVALRSLGPLGLAWHETSVCEGQTSRVFPRAHFEGRSGLILRQATVRRIGANPLQARGLSNELYALREYVSGDDYRHIHWKQTARLNRPLVVEHTWEQHQQIVVMLDCGRTMASMAGSYSKLDHTLAAILALMRVIIAQQDSATLVLFSKEIRQVVRVDRRTRGFASVFERLYRESADLEEPNYAEIAGWCARRIPRRSLVLVATSVIDMLSAEMLGRALRGLSARHRPLLVNLQDPELIGWQQAIPEDVDGSFAKASAMAIGESNRALGTRLRAHGVDVLSTPASNLVIGMIQRYLDFKARARI